MGRLERRHGAGAFVAPPKPDQGLTTGSFAVDVRRRGAVPDARTLAADRVLAGPQLSRRP